MTSVLRLCPDRLRAHAAATAALADELGMVATWIPVGTETERAQAVVRRIVADLAELGAALAEAANAAERADLSTARSLYRLWPTSEPGSW